MFFFLWVVTPSVLFGPRHHWYVLFGPLRSSPSVLFGPLRSTPSFLFGPLRSSSVLFGPLRSSSVLFGPLRSYSVLFGPLRSSPSGLFFPRQRPSSVLTIASGKHKPVTKSCFNKLDGITMLKIKILKLKSLVS
jgi:hypothetical protein